MQTPGGPASARSAPCQQKRDYRAVTALCGDLHSQLGPGIGAAV